MRVGMRGKGAAIVLVVTALIGLVAPPDIASARDYESGFGFGISVPDAWLVLTRGEVEQHANLLVGGEESEALRSVSSRMRRVVYERVRRGELEILYRREGVSGDFVDNVNIMLQPARLPEGPSQLQALCRLLPIEFSKIFGRPIAMDGCEMRERGGRLALYLEFDGAIPGTTTLQYQLARDAGSTVVITATAEDANLPRLLGEFEQIVGSIRMH